MKQLIRSLVPAFLLAITLPTAALANQLTGEEARALVVGKTVYFRAGSNAPVMEVRMQPDGTSTTTALGGDTGRWWASPEGYCAVWTRVRGGQERCFTIRKVLWNYEIVSPDGSFVSIVRIE